MKFGSKLYYFNEQTDEVVHFKTYNKIIDKNYKYIHKNFLYNLWSFLIYYLIATPVVWIYYKLIKKVKIINKQVLKKHKKEGYFIYANHTNQFADAFCPVLICLPQKINVVVNADNISVPIIGKFLKTCGALPVPTTIGAVKNFNFAIEYYINNNRPILIYPEAHLWPFYTKIRNFSSTSFKYAVKLNKPVFSFTTVYKLKKYGKKPKVEIYIDGPFFADTKISIKDAQQKLRDEVFYTMQQRSKNSNYNYFNYIKRSNND